MKLANNKNLPVFEERSEFDRTLVNPALTSLAPLRLENFLCVYTESDRSTDLVESMTKAVGVTHEMRVVGPLMAGPGKWRIDLFVNGIFVAQGFGSGIHGAKGLCCDNAIGFMRSIGLKLRLDERLSDEQVKVVVKEDLQSLSIRQHFTSFIEDAKIVKLVFKFVVNQAEKELFETLCGKFSLMLVFDGSSLTALKKNSIVHKMELLPPVNPTPKPRLTHITVTKEDLAANPSVKGHIEKFVANSSVSKLIFSGELDVSQKELIELLSHKYKVKHEDEGLGEIVLWKYPARTKSVPTHHDNGYQFTRVNISVYHIFFL